MNQEIKACFDGDSGCRSWQHPCLASRTDVENNMSHRPELQLITDARNGDRDAMAELFRRHHPLLIRVARRILPACDEYSDAVQSAYLSAFRNFKSFRGDSSFRTWITQIVINQCRRHLQCIRASDPLGTNLRQSSNQQRAAPGEEASRNRAYGRATDDGAQGTVRALVHVGVPGSCGRPWRSPRRSPRITLAGHPRRPSHHRAVPDTDQTSAGVQGD